MLRILLFFIASSALFSAFAQGTQERFGQNRVQYKEFEWQSYESEHFATYFNKGGQQLGRFASQMAETDLRQIEQMLDYRVNRQIAIVVYNTISDLNQTNIGAAAGVSYNTGGTTAIIDNKMFVYFNGSHADLRRQIREGIARILVANMIFGGNLQEIVQNAVLLHLPEWFSEGLVAYIGQEWNSDLDDQLHDGMVSGRYDKFNKLTGTDARFAGHSLWYFIAEKYGVGNIPNLLYLIRVNRSLENGFLFVLGASVPQVIEEWREHYMNKYELEEKGREQPDENLLVDKKYRKRLDYYGLALNPTGTHLAYVTNDEGRYTVRLQELALPSGRARTIASSEPVDLTKGKAKKVKRGGIKTRNLATDLSYPLMAWDSRGNRLAIVYEKRARIQLVLYDLETGKKEESEIARFQRIQSIAFTNDPRKVVFSALNKGQSDLYYYYVNNARLQQITNDYYDDLEPAWVSIGGREGVIFASNRDVDTLLNLREDSVLPVGSMDLWFYDDENSRKSLLRVTRTPDVDEHKPQALDDEHFSFLSDAVGISNRYAGYIDSVYAYTAVTAFFKDSVAFNPRYSLEPFQLAGLVDSVWETPVYRDTAIVFPVSNYARNIREQSTAPRIGRSADLFIVNGRPEFYIHTLPTDLEAAAPEELKSTGYRTNSKSKTEESPKEEEPEEKPSFWFQSEFPRVTLSTETLTKAQPEARPVSNEGQSNLVYRGDPFRRGNIRPYRVQFSTESVTTQLDNSLFINRYQSFRAGGGQFNQPNLSGLFTVSIADLFEDHRFIGGFRLPTSFNGSEYFLTYFYNSRRLDKQLLYYYGANRTAYDVRPIWNDPLNAKVKTNIAQVTLTWPFDVIRSVRGNFTYRNDKINFLAADEFSLNLPNEKDDWVSAKVEYVHDNTIQLATNLPLGARWKVWAEMHKGFEVNVTDRVNLSFDDGFLGVVGFDGRHYLRVHRNIIWANRIAGASSFGASKLIYYLGGVDSWIGARFNTETVIDPNVNYAFQTLSTNMRGFDQNARNGSSYAVWNSELRVPLFSYLVNKPIRSELIRNFQVLGFFDAGSAWQGALPFDDEDRFNTVITVNGPITTTVNYFQNPVVFGYGFGARTLIFGYFLRFDMAWGLDTGEILDPTYYFSLSLDF